MCVSVSPVVVVVCFAAILLTFLLFCVYLCMSIFLFLWALLPEVKHWLIDDVSLTFRCAIDMSGIMFTVGDFCWFCLWLRFSQPVCARLCQLGYIYACLSEGLLGKWRMNCQEMFLEWLGIGMRDSLDFVGDPSPGGFMPLSNTLPSVSGGILFLSCSSVRPSVRAFMCASRNIVNTIYCRVFDAYSPNFTINNALCDRDEHVKIWGQKSAVKVTVE